MDAAERAFIESLLQTHRSHLQVLEQQAATFGVMAPPYVVTQVAEYRQKIAELESRLRPIIPHQNGLPRHNLPPRYYERYVGRQKELAEVRRLIGSRSRAFVVTIDGIGGIGKSALALETAYSFVDQYDQLPEAERFDAIVWLSAKRTYLTASGIRERRQVFGTLNDLYSAIARVLDEPSITHAQPEDRLTIVEQLLRGLRTLLILDNLETIDDEDLLAFLHELPEPTKAIVTTRHRIDAGRTMRLTGMQHDDAHTLIDQEARRKVVTLSVTEREALWQRTGGMPLAIVWSIGLMGLGGSVESVLRRLGSGQNDMARFCFNESVEKIREKDAYGLLLGLALFEANASRTMLGEIADLVEDEFGRDEGLAELIRLSLVTKEGDRFELLPLTRSYVLDQLAHQPELEHHLRERWIACLSAIAKPYASPSWFDRRPLGREGFHLVTLSQWAQENARPDVLLPIIPALVHYYDLKGDWLERTNIGTIGLEYARLVGDLWSIAFIETYAFGWVLSQQGRHAEAEQYLTDALNLVRQTGDIAWQCTILLRYAQALRRRKAFDQVERYCQEALQLTLLLPEEQRLYIHSEIENELGKIARDHGDWTIAQAHFLAARDAFGPDASDTSFKFERVWGVLGNLGFVAHKLGDLDTAAQMYEQSLDFCREMGGKGYMTTLLVRLATLEEQRGNRQIALAYGQEALEWSRLMGMEQEHTDAATLLVRLEA